MSGAESRLGAESRGGRFLQGPIVATAKGDVDEPEKLDIGTDIATYFEAMPGTVFVASADDLAPNDTPDQGTFQPTLPSIG